MTGLIAAIVLTIGLSAATITDMATRRIPDSVTLPLIAAGLALALWQGAFWPSAIGAGLGYGVFWAVSRGYRHMRRREGLGLGDAKLLAAGGAWCGSAALPFIVVVAAGTALIWLAVHSLWKQDRTVLWQPVPFGPFLSLGIAATYLAETLCSAPV